MKLFEIATRTPTSEAKLPQQDIDKAILLYKKEIEPQCQEYLHLVGEHELFRGMYVKEAMGMFSTHANRSPKDTGILTHNIVNDIFQYETGIRIRSSNALFVTADKRSTTTFGETYIIFVPGKVNYTFLAGIYDLTDQVIEFVRAMDDAGEDKNSVGYMQHLRDVLTDKLTPLIRHNKDIDQAIKNGDEIIFTTPTYYAIGSTLWEQIKPLI